MSSFCLVATHHLNIKPGGFVSPCWRATIPENSKSINNTSLKEVWNSTELIAVRKDLSQERFPNTCESCAEYEKIGADSTRILLRPHYLEMKKLQKSILADNETLSNILSLEIRLSNLCNLSCLHCSPKFSSVWEQRIEKISAEEKIFWESAHGSPDFNSDPLNLDAISEIINLINLGNIQEILWAGGEPLINADHYRILSSINDAQAAGIELSYSTNLNILKPEMDEIYKLWKKFKLVKIRISIDATPENYEYIRHGGKIDRVIQNILFLQENVDNLKIFGTCTTSLLNIKFYSAILYFFKSLNIFFDVCMVQTPKHLSIVNLPLFLKNQYSQQILDTLKYLNDDHTSSFSEEYAKHAQFHTKRVLDFMNNQTGDIELFRTFMHHIDALNGSDHYEYYSDYYSNN